MDTRKRSGSANDNIFKPAFLPEQSLPTVVDVLNYFLYLKRNVPDLTDQNASKLVATKILDMWNKTSIPTILYKSAVTIIQITNFS